jgi:hypothetical protein
MLLRTVTFSERGCGMLKRPMCQTFECGISLHGIWPQTSDVTEKRVFCFCCDRQPLHPANGAGVFTVISEVTLDRKPATLSQTR